ncbi:MAG: DoxX family protein [Kocuria sp.]|nr:DoxX family protein [Kocuria sp.]MDO5619642.1 DoxX family protein [Kocuria sp.]
MIKTTAAVGLLAGIWIPGVAFAANTGVIIYFVSAAVAHFRARFTGQAFWMNCLGMLALSLAVQVLSYVI